MDISFEFFPPKTEAGSKKLKSTHEKLKAINPEFFSVTFGAGGSTQDGTYQAVLSIQEAGSQAAPHLSCMGTTKEKIAQLLEQYKAHGVSRIVALRGDVPENQATSGDFQYASELVSFIREHSGNHFFIEVAAYPEMHPQAPSPAVDLEHFVHKVNCGANSAITQYFFNPDAFLYFRDQAKRKVNVPIVPGIMPITNYQQLARFSDACGAEIPRWVRQRLQSLETNPSALREFGCEVVSNLCNQLVREGVDGLHLYTLNAAEPSLAILKNLGFDLQTAQGTDKGRATV